jgi:hypothetical protein
MSAFNSSSSLKPVAYELSALKPHLPKSNHRDSETSQVLLAGILSDLKTHKKDDAQMKSFVSYYASFFDMSALELAAWCHLLRLHSPASDTLAAQVSTLRITCFHAKAILGNSMNSYWSEIEADGPHFSAEYEALKDSLPTHLSMQEVHKTYAELMRRVYLPKRVRNTNKVVDEILQVREVCEEQRVVKPKKARKREEVIIDIASTPFLPIIPSCGDLSFPEFSTNTEVDDSLFDVGIYLS